MLANLIVSGLSLLLLLCIVCKAWCDTPEIRCSTTDRYIAHDFAAPRQRAANGREHNSPGTSCLEPSPSATLPYQIAKR